jgi:hypothetical protein
MWSFAEALLDTCAIMQGKAIPILKSDIILELPDLFLISRDYLKQKTAAFTDTKELSFSYQDYLGVFLIMKNKEDLLFRSMDLIQENIKLRYAVESFHIDHCIYGFEAEADFAAGSKFTGFTFLQKYLDCIPIKVIREKAQAADVARPWQ